MSHKQKSKTIFINFQACLAHLFIFIAAVNAMSLASSPCQFSRAGKYYSLEKADLVVQ